MATHGDQLLLNTWYAKRIIGDAGANNTSSALIQTGVAENMWLLVNTTRLSASTSKLYGIKYVYDQSSHDKIELYGGSTSAAATAWVQLDTGAAFFKGKVTIGSQSVTNDNLLEVYGATLLKNTLVIDHTTPSIELKAGTSSIWYLQNNSSNNFTITDGASSNPTTIIGYSGYGFSITPNLYINDVLSPVPSTIYNLYVNGTSNITGATILGNTLSVTGATTLSSTLNVASTSTFASEVDITVTSPITVSNSTATGALIIGTQNGNHIAFDNTGIRAFDGTNANSTLYLNSAGGDVSIGGATATLTLASSTVGATAWTINNTSSVFSITDANTVASFIGTVATASGITPATYLGFSISPRLYINTTVANATYNLYVNGSSYFNGTSCFKTSTDATADLKFTIVGSSYRLSMTGRGLQAYNASNKTAQALYLNGNGGQIYLGKDNTASTVTISYTTNADSSTNGALYVKGGIKAVKNVYVGGALNVTGNTTLGGTLDVTGNTSITGTLSVTSTSAFTGAITANGNLTITNTSPTISLTNTGTGIASWTISNDSTGIFTIIDNDSTAPAYIKGYKTLGFIAYPHLYIGYASDLTSTDTYNLYVAGTSNITGNTTIGGTLTVTGATTLNGGINTTTLTTSGDITSQTDIWAGASGYTNVEHDSGVLSGAGKIYLYSVSSNSGNRGIGLVNASNTSGDLVTINQNNFISYLAPMVNDFVLYNGTFARGTATASASTVAIKIQTNGNNGHEDLSAITNYYNGTGTNTKEHELRLTIYEPKSASAGTGTLKLVSNQTAASTYRTYIDSNIDMQIQKGTPTLSIINSNFTRDGSSPQTADSSYIIFKDTAGKKLGMIKNTLNNATTKLFIGIHPNKVTDDTFVGVTLSQSITSGAVNPMLMAVDGNIQLQKSTTTITDEGASIKFSLTDDTAGTPEGYEGTLAYTQNNAFITAYHTHEARNIGMNMVIQSGGNMFIGAGESPNQLYQLLRDNASSVLTGETLYLTADSEIIIQSKVRNADNADSGLAERHGFKVTTNGNLIPIAQEVERNYNSSTGDGANIGSATAVLKNIYANTFIGSLTGHASLDLALTGGTMTGGITLHNSGSAMTWPAPSNITCTATANNQEWSFDMNPGSYTGTYWHVWSSTNGKSVLICRNDDMKVQVPNGLLEITNNGNTLTIGSQNSSFCHFSNSASVPFYFDKGIMMAQGCTIGGPSYQYRPYQLYLGRNSTADSRALDSANPLIEFANSNRSQYAQLVYTDYNNQGGSDSLTLVSNQTDCRFYAPKVHNAVWNDYAECRIADTIEPGYCVTETSSGLMTKSTERLMPGCKLTSDTYGTCMGETPEAKTPIAVAGRVLAYPYRPREEYELGAAVCSAPGGTVDIMTREEIMMYPERIIGTVSEIPNYDIWYAGYEGRMEIEVNGRIWIYVR